MVPLVMSRPILGRSTPHFKPPTKPTTVPAHHTKTQDPRWEPKARQTTELEEASHGACSRSQRLDRFLPPAWEDLASARALSRHPFLSRWNRQDTTRLRAGSTAILGVENHHQTVLFVRQNGPPEPAPDAPASPWTRIPLAGPRDSLLRRGADRRFTNFPPSPNDM